MSSDHRPMFVGVCRVWLQMPENSSLKDKRQVLRSLTQRVRNKFDVAIAEMDAVHEWQTACLGVAAISNNAQHTNEVLSKVMRFIEETRLDAQLYDYQMEIHAL